MHAGYRLKNFFASPRLLALAFFLSLSQRTGHAAVITIGGGNFRLLTELSQLITSAYRFQEQKNSTRLRSAADSKTSLKVPPKYNDGLSLPMTCGPAPIVDHSVIDEASFDGNSDSTIGDYLWYRCNRGWQMVANAAITCYGTGEWGPRLPQCARQYYGSILAPPSSLALDMQCLSSRRNHDDNASFDSSECFFKEIRWRFDSVLQRCHVFHQCLKVNANTDPERRHAYRNSFLTKNKCLETCLPFYAVTPPPAARMQMRNETALTTTTPRPRWSSFKIARLTTTPTIRLDRPHEHEIHVQNHDSHHHHNASRQDDSSEIVWFLISENLLTVSPREPESTRARKPPPSPRSTFLTRTRVPKPTTKRPNRRDRPHQHTHLKISGGLRGPHCLPGVILVKQHSSCLPDSPRIVDTVPFPIDEPLKLHYLWRRIALESEIAAGESVDESKLPLLVWSDEMAINAERHASQCRESHDEMAQRTVPSLGLNETAGVGQNICWASWDESIKECVSEWALRQRLSLEPDDNEDDILDAFSAVTDTSLFTDLPPVPDYDESREKLYIGCGKAHCRPPTNDWDFTIVCNYGPNRNNFFVQHGGYLQGDSGPPEFESHEEMYSSGYDVKPIE